MPGGGGEVFFLSVAIQLLLSRLSWPELAGLALARLAGLPGGSSSYAF